MDSSQSTKTEWNAALRSPVQWLTGQLAQIDAQWITAGKKASDKVLVTNVVLTSLVLFLLNYVAMDRRIQTQVSWFFIEVFDIWDYSMTGWILPEQMALAQRISWVGFCVLFYLGIPLVFHLLILRKPASDLGLSVKGYSKHLWIYVLLFVPVGALVFLVSFSQSF